MEMFCKRVKELRVENGITQKQLADALLISDKTVSKWECGNGMPEVSLMMPLCETLGITVNELLSAKRLSTSDYQKNAEENIMKLIKEKQEAKFRMIIEVLVIFITLLSGSSLVLVSGLVDLKSSIRIALIVIAFLLGKTSQNNTGKYQIFMHPTYRADQFLLDTQSGRTWQMTQESKEKYMFWHEIPRDELPLETENK